MKVGDGLKILYKAGFPAVATQPNGQSVFEQAQIDGDDNKAYAVLAGRTDGKQPETKAGTEATDEPLFTLHIMVRAPLNTAVQPTFRSQNLKELPI